MKRFILFIGIGSIGPIGTVVAAPSDAVGRNQDENDPFQWLQKAAARGEKSANLPLGLMYDQGLGVTQDRSEAFICFLKAAVDGDGGAQSLVGARLLQGLGVKQNPREGIEWLTKAANQEVASAQVMLAGVYERGEGVPKDRVQADFWYKRAAKEGNPAGAVVIENQQTRDGARDAVQALEPTAIEKTSFSAEAPAVGRDENTVLLGNKYVVKAGDDRGRIARTKGVPVAELQLANPDVDWTKLRVGQIISLPSIRPDDLRKPVDAFEISQLEQAPVARFQVRPQYPFALRRDGVAGEVVVDFIIDANGDVQSAYAVRSSRKEFEAAAVQAVTKWKFRPGRKGGRAVSAHMQVPIMFTLNEE